MKNIKARKSEGISLKFCSSEALIEAVYELYTNRKEIKPDSCYKLYENYFVIMRGTLTDRLRAKSRGAYFSSVKLAVIKEHGSIIFKESELEKIYKIFFKGS